MQGCRGACGGSPKTESRKDGGYILVLHEI